MLQGWNAASTRCARPSTQPDVQVPVAHLRADFKPADLVEIRARSAPGIRPGCVAARDGDPHRHRRSQASHHHDHDFKMSVVDDRPTAVIDPLDGPALALAGPDRHMNANRKVIDDGVVYFARGGNCRGGRSASSPAPRDSTPPRP